MLIKIDDSVVDYITSKELRETDPEIIALNNLALAFREGKHILVGSLKVLETLKDFILLDISARRVYTNLFSKFTFLRMYETNLNDYVIVKSREFPFSRTIHGLKQIFEIPITYYVRLDNSDKTYLICEDLSDHDFYIKLANKFIEENKHHYNVRLSFNPANGGGNNTYRLFERHIENFSKVLAIADSDKEFPNANIGQTLLNLRGSFSRLKDSYIVDLFELQVREKENLISPSLYLLGANSSTKNILYKLSQIEYNQVHQEKLMYLDVKDGLRVGRLKANSDCIKYYGELFREVSDLIACSIEELSNLDDDYKLIEGTGSNLIHDFVCNVLGDGLETKLEQKKAIEGIPIEVLLELEENIEKKKQLFSNIPTYLKPHLESLCKKIISWGCCNNILPT